ncbi:Glutathione-dependent formaldehyde-activating enzyme/centromere protein V [Penicillium italicum]|uniref:Glutathione-dependent formaldehyde-activating enzyme/centromere protein V n=1 Tax=Penicillium italicum TaxID=40296 RepID=A0A0A2LCF1_PENIT|nr:Glutathione-dependent formaldehyde-activating enzyme/centromere protein V [Penicillium italicum]
MPTGSCLCHILKFQYTTEPIKKASGFPATCYCLSCRKISGGTHTLSLLIPEDKFRVTDGSVTKYTEMHESGMKLTVHFCGNCGCTIYKTHEKFPGMVVILAGTLDEPDALEQSKPEAEFYSQYRAGWVPKFGWAEQRVEF